MKVTLIDHEDSFVYNLDQGFQRLGARVTTIRYTEAPDTLSASGPDAFVFSPGPGHPADRKLTGLARTVLQGPLGDRPILGVCLGHQLIAHAGGARVIPAAKPVHGETDAIYHTGEGVLRGLPSPFTAARYHSLVVDPTSLPPNLTVTATGAGREVMALTDRNKPIFGVQFHPESYLTPHGEQILRNFISEVRK